MTTKLGGLNKTNAYSSLGQKSNTGLTSYNQRVGRAAFLLGGSREGSLPLPDPSGH